MLIAARARTAADGPEMQLLIAWQISLLLTAFGHQG